MAMQNNSSNPIISWRRFYHLLRCPCELLLLLAAFTAVYWRTMPPGISSWIVEGWDSAVLQITGSTWGVPHSPGYPLYTILTNIFVRLVGLAPGGAATSVAWRVTLWSLVTALLALTFVYFATWKLTRDRAAAVIAGAVLGLSFIFWRGAIMAEVYSMNAFIFAFTYWLALTWAADRRDRWLAALGLTVGAGLVHHRTAFILFPTAGLWLLLQTFKSVPVERRDQIWRLVARRWGILIISATPPLLTYLYLIWAANNRVGQTWLYADTSDWNTFWFVALAREWWGLLEVPGTAARWWATLRELFRQQAGQITAGGAVVGLVGLALSGRALWLFGPPLLAFMVFGVSYHVADLDSMLIPLTLTLCIGLGILLAKITRWLVGLARQREPSADRWLSVTVRIGLALLWLACAYFVFSPLAEENYQEVDLSGDWQAEDLVEEVVAIAQAGTPLTIIGQDNSVLPDFIYARVVLGQPVEPLSTTQLSRMPEEASIALLQERFEQQRRVFVDIETIDLNFIPWLSRAIDTGRIFLAPTGHPYLWELLPRPMSNVLPQQEEWQQIPPGQFLDGRLSIIAFHERIVSKRTGCFLRLSLFWRAERDIEEDYFVAVQPLGGEMVIDKNDHLGLMRGYLPTSSLQPGEVVRDEVDLLIRQPAALPGINLVVNLYQVQGNQFPTFGEATLPITVGPDGCKQKLVPPARSGPISVWRNDNASRP